VRAFGPQQPNDPQEAVPDHHPSIGSNTRQKMFAVIKTGGKQYRVAADNVITVEKVAGEPGDIVAFGEVLMLGGESPVVGNPLVAGASVAGEVLQQGRGPKVIAFKKRRRQNSKRKRGHRQEFTMVRVTEILTDGKKPSPKAEMKPRVKRKKPAADDSAAAAPDAGAAPAA
jgi:large subunit ribosomal protein L21